MLFPESLSHQLLKKVPSAPETCSVKSGDVMPQDLSTVLELVSGVGADVLKGTMPVALGLLYVPLPLNVGAVPLRGRTMRYMSGCDAASRWAFQSSL